MAKFRFELEAVIKQRAAVERAKQLALAQAELERGAIEDEIRACQKGIDDEKAAVRDALMPGRPASVRDARMQVSASLQFMVRAQRAAIRLAGAMKRVDRTRSELLSATTAKKAVEKLRERRYEAWQAEQVARENAAIDELSVMRAFARPGGVESES